MPAKVKAGTIDEYLAALSDDKRAALRLAASLRRRPGPSSQQGNQDKSG